jgi:RecA-family ATPase
MGGQVIAHGTAVMLAAEDSTEAIHRRFNRMDPDGKRMMAPDKLIVVPMASAGGARALIASDGKNLSRTAFFHDLKAQLKAIPDFRLGILDPLQAMAMADVNADPAAAQFFWSAVAELAAETGGTFIIPHHMRKDGMNKISTGADAREGIRGTTALVDGARLAYVLWAVGKDDAEAICTSLEIDHEEGKIVRGAVVKSNDEADFSTHTYVRQESGLLVQLAHDPEPSASPAMATSTAHAILKDAEERWQAGHPYSERAQAGSRYIVHVIMRTLDCNRKGAVSILNQWIKNGVVRSEMRDNKSKMYGLRVLFYPG